MVETGLNGRTVVVTGANNPVGIGAAVARAFGHQRAKIFLHYFRVAKPSRAKVDLDRAGESGPGESFYYAQGSKSADEVLKALAILGVDTYAWEADFTDPRTVLELFDKAESELGPVEVLVNNAANWEADTFLPEDVPLAADHVEKWTHRPRTIDAGSFDRLFAVNARAVALLMAEFARRHIRRGAKWGRIVNISTDGAYCFPSEVSYGASKLALEGLTRSAAVEFGRFGITVNAISPGPIQTGWITPELESDIIPTIPLGRLGEPGDIADAVVFLASNQARWITGQRIHVGGGHSM